MITIEEVQERIKQLNTLSEVMLESEMDALKETLLQNENIVQNLLPEDIGEIVKNLERIRGILDKQKEEKRGGRKPAAKKVPLEMDSEL